MTGIVAKVPWVEFGHKFRETAFALIRCGNIISWPFFSKKAGKTYCEYMAGEYGLDIADFSGAVAMLEASDLSDGLTEFDILVADLYAGLIKDEVRPSPLEFMEILEKTMNRLELGTPEPEEDKEPEGDIVFNAVYDEQSFSIACCRFVADHNGQKISTEPFFSRNAGDRIIMNMRDNLNMSRGAMKRMVRELNSKGLPIRTTEMDLALRNFIAFTHLCRRSKQANRHLETLIKEDMMLNLFGPRGWGIDQAPVLDLSFANGKQGMIVGHVDDGAPADVSEDICLMIENSVVLYGVLKCGNVQTQPFFSKHCAWNCLTAMVSQYELNEDDVAKTEVAINMLDIFPEEPVNYDRAASRFIQLCIKTNRSNQAFNHIYKLIELGIFLDMFGDESDPS